MKIKLIQPKMFPRPMDTKLKTSHIMFIDDNFIGNPKWTKKLLKEIKPLKLKWNAAVTSNIVDMLELLDEMHERGIMINASFVFGLDEDDVSVFKNTLEWIVKNKIETVT